MERCQSGAAPAALREDLRRVARIEETSDPPSKREYETHGEWATSTVLRHLGGDGESWPAALDAAGLDGDAARARAPGTAADPDALREDLRRVAAREDTADPPTMTEYDAHGEWALSTVVDHLAGEEGSWGAALDAAGLDGDASGRGRGRVPDPDDLRADLRRVARREDTRDPPTADDYRTHGDCVVKTVVRHLAGDDGSWTDALDAAGLDGAAARERTPATADADALCADLRRVAEMDDTSDPPTWDDYEAHGEWTAQTVGKHLAGDDRSWTDALDAAGLDGAAARERTPATVDADALREDLRRVAAREDTADPPTVPEYDARGEWSSTTVADYLGDGSWADALDAAGLDGDAARARATGGSTEVSRDALLDALRDLAAMPGTSDPPTVGDMREVGRYAAATYRRRFGSWAAALDAAGLDGDAARARGPSEGSNQISRADLLADVERVAARDDTSDPPTTTEYCVHGEYSTLTVRRRIGPWADAIDAAGLDGDAVRVRAPDGGVGGGGDGAGGGGGGGEASREADD